jgi:hypothetical protein
MRSMKTSVKISQSQRSLHMHIYQNCMTEDLQFPSTQISEYGNWVAVKRISNSSLVGTQTYS